MVQQHAAVQAGAEVARAELLWQLGFVWDAPAARALREKHRLVGDAVGCLAGYPQQVAVAGLPLVLTREEVVVGLQQGSLRLDDSQLVDTPACEQPSSAEQHTAECFSARAPEPGEALEARSQQGTTAAPPQAPQPQEPGQAPSASGSSTVASSAPEPSGARADAGSPVASCSGESVPADAAPCSGEVAPASTSEACWREAHEPLPAGSNRDGALAAAAELVQEVGPVEAARSCEAHELESLRSSLSESEAHECGGSDSDGSTASWPPSGRLASHPIMSRVGDDEPCSAGDALAWRGALERKAPVSLPLTWPPGSAAAGWQVPGAAVARAPDAAAPKLQPEHDRVFSDLHARGYCISGGSKFGALWLLYPGDPSLYHAQYTVRVVPPSTPLDIVLLAAAQRSSHAARKHMVVAVPGAQVSYLTLAPEAGFGAA